MTDTCTYPPCGKELKHIEGRRKKKYCDAKCKLKHWQLLNPVKKELKTKRIPIKQWEEIQKKIAENNKPENKARIEAERNPPSEKKPFPTLEELAKRKKDFEKRLEEELPFNTTKSTNQPNPPTTLDEQELKKQIEAIRAEKIPEHRNKSTLGKKSWEAEQKQRILQIQEQINSLK